MILTAPEAADYLEIKTATLYAYVSRGLLDSVPISGDARRRGYRKDDLDRLKRRSDAHAGHGAAASSALDWGAPSLDTALSKITPEGAAYRGRPVVDLVRERVPFESVAEFLWSGEMPSARPRWFDASSVPVPLGALLAPDAWPIDVLRVAVTLAGLDDPARFSGSAEAELHVARQLVARAVGSLAVHHGAKVEGADSLAEVFASAFAPEPVPLRSLAAIDTALVVLADHELNASTFTARVAASTGADVYACVSAALATFTGPRHGGACDPCAALVSEVETRGSAGAVLTERVRRGEAPPGFGHRLYAEGDPRFALLMELAGAVGDRGMPWWLEELLAVAEAMELGAPTSDMGLVILSRSLGLPSAAAVTLFAVGRMAGWIAHAYEQRRQGFLLRPRARYVGP